MVDPDDELTDVRMPEQGTHGHVTLLLAEHLAARQGPAITAELKRTVRELADVLRPAVDGGDAGATAVGEQAVARLPAAVGYGPATPPRTPTPGSTPTAASGSARSPAAGRSPPPNTSAR
jgi:hypothetical protein